MGRGLYPDDLAERFKAHVGEKYRPSNGTEGQLFMDWFCDRCKRDAAFRDGSGDSCPIVADAFTFNVSDPKYPAEWQYGTDGQPCCTAFEREDAPDARDENAAVGDLFDG